MLFGVHKSTLRFNNLLEGLIKFRKSLIFMIMVYYSERTQVKISKDKRSASRQSPGEIRHSFPLSSPNGVI